MKRMTAFQLGSCIGKSGLSTELAIAAMQNGIRPPVTLVRSWDPLPTLESMLEEDAAKIGRAPWNGDFSSKIDRQHSIITLRNYSKGSSLPARLLI